MPSRFMVAPVDNPPLRPNDGPILYYNRYTQTIETEAVYGDAYLKWLYGGSLSGRIALGTVAKRAAFSRFYGWRMAQPRSRAKIRPFIERYGVNTEEMAKSPEEFRSFNDFFIRTLRPEARPIDSTPSSIVFPADGRHLGLPNINAVEGIFVKGQHLDLAALVPDPEDEERFAKATIVISRLCPVDYHRFHAPWTGQPQGIVEEPGPLLSVNPIALRQQIAILTQNKRSTLRLKSQDLGHILVIAVGATCVGSIHWTLEPGNDPVDKGDELGFFEFGGSTVITLFEPGRVRLEGDLLKYSGECRETYARMGDRMASVIAR